MLYNNSDTILKHSEFVDSLLNEGHFKKLLEYTLKRKANIVIITEDYKNVLQIISFKEVEKRLSKLNKS